MKKTSWTMRDIKKHLELPKSKMPKDVVEAHTHSSKHRAELLSSDICGCFYCLEIYKPTEIVEWIDDGECAMCPKCEIDAVIGDRSGFPITKEFLAEMHKYWFS